MAVFNFSESMRGLLSRDAYRSFLPFEDEAKITKNTLYVSDGDEDNFAFARGTFRYVGSGDSIDQLLGGTLRSLEVQQGDRHLVATGLTISVERYAEMTEGQTWEADDDGLRDMIIGGNDRIYATAFNDEMGGHDGNDTIHGGNGNDKLDGDDGADRLFGEVGNDILDGDDGNDLLYGGMGRDILESDDGNDRLFGGSGQDTLEGGRGNDFLHGGSENDWIAGSEGRDTLVGGAGSDVFIFDTRVVKGQIDTITDFNAPQDQIEISTEYFDADWIRDVRPDNFTLGLVAQDDEDHLIYHKKTGRLFFDEDGKGGDAAIQFAKLAPNTNLSWADFDLI